MLHSPLHSQRSLAVASMPPKKRRRGVDVGNLTSILHTGSISTTGLTELVRRLRDQNIDLGSIGRWSLRDANYDLLDRYGVVDTLPLVEGADGFKWTYLAPAAWLAALVGKSSALESLFAAALAKAPCSIHRPWSLIIGFDEFAPGNKLAVYNSRKCMVLSLTFRELGQEAISGGQGWITPAVIRSTVLANVRGGWSAALCSFLERAMFGENGFATTGCPLIVRGSVVCIFARVVNILSDGDGLRMALDWRGASSLKPCFRHHNVLKKVSRLFGQLLHNHMSHVEHPLVSLATSSLAA